MMWKENIEIGHGIFGKKVGGKIRLYFLKFILWVRK